MIVEIIAITVFIVSITVGLGYFNPTGSTKWSITNVWKEMPHNRRKLILCVLGWLAFVVLSSLFSTVVVVPALGKTLSLVYSLFAGMAIYLFWYFRYQKLKE